MRNLKNLFFFSLISSLFLMSCGKEGAPGGTIASQVTGVFLSIDANIVVDNETLLEGAKDYKMTITEVDANTVSVITEYTAPFEVDLEKSDNGELTTGTSGSASNFTFVYQVSEETINIEYQKDGVIMSYTGEKD